MTDTEQRELELINQQLLRARDDLECSLRRYRELFDAFYDVKLTATCLVGYWARRATPSCRALWA